MASATLEEKINKIRQQNEEIRRRHEEVEADKQNAAKLNALVKMVPPTDWPERKEPPEFSNPPPPRNNGNSKPKNSPREYQGQPQQYHAGSREGKKIHVFADGDGPPPDPTYNFLADSEREERNRDESREERFRGRGAPLRGGSRRRGGGREGHPKEYRGAGPAPKDATKPEYEAWRAERNRIDEARISRQRTAEGNWRREWDNNKMNVDEDEARTQKVTRLDLADIPRKEHKDFDKWQSDGNDYDSPRGRGGKQYIGRGAPRGSHSNRVYQHSNSFDQFHSPVSPPATKTPLSPTGIDDRMVLATDKSLKVIVNHGTTVPKGPVMSVKVSPASIAGTGRVGPRQKPRIMYSSQSEAEIGQEVDAMSRHKSPEDKTNRVSFNRDFGEQRYAPKSPHPQRKGESNSKSPYLGRKEYKHDSQQQKHGENEPKSPYLQRREFKDPPKSPHFQKKSDPTNRDAQKQKNSAPANESFKPINPQRRTSEKTKTDSLKFPVPRKSEDPSAPKPQRINKRNEKSKGFHPKSKEAQESLINESNAQANNLSTEESTKNAVNGQDDVKKNVPGESVAVETTALHQRNDENGAQKQNSDPETLSPSRGSEGNSQSITDALKSIVDSDATIPISTVSGEGPKSENVSGNEPKLNPINTETIADAKSAGDEENIRDVECDVKAPEAANGEKNDTEIPLINGNETNNSQKTDEAKNTQVISDNELKYEANPMDAVNIDDVEKCEEKIVAPENEFKVYETKDEVSLKPEETAEEVPQAQNNLKESQDKVETVGDDLKVVEMKDEASLKPEEIPNDMPSTPEIVNSDKPEEKSAEIVGNELDMKKTTDEMSPKSDESVIEISKAEEKLMELTTAKNGLKIDETKDAIIPEPQKTAIKIADGKETPQVIEENDVNEIVKDSLAV